MFGPVLLVGCGRMGSALAAGWLRSYPEADIRVVNPGPVALALTRYNSAAEIPAGFAPQLVVLAVKPQQAAGVLPQYARFKEATFLSILAGTTLAKLEQGLGPVAIVRAMPNTPAAIGHGIAVMVANARVRDASRALAETALQAGGKTEWMANETRLDAVTALSGSGPAYVFLLVEVLAGAGVNLGLPADLAMRLARETVIGSAALLSHSSDSVAILRQNVTSPGGTTAAALSVLQYGRLQTLFDEALTQAASRSRELAK